MSSTNKTPNYALPQFIPTDKPTWLGDVNAAMLAIDTAMADNHTTAESANTSASAAVAQVQHAVDTANDAKVDSAAALQNATNAVGVAQNALNSATQATQTAQAATQTANAANNSAASAVATANQAKQTADATDAELTEFEHYFDRATCYSLIQPDSATSYAYATTNLIELYYQGTHLTISEQEQTLWEFNGYLIPIDNWQYEIENGIILIFKPLENGKQKIAVKTTSGTYSPTTDIGFLLYVSKSNFLTFYNANKNNPTPSTAKNIRNAHTPSLISYKV